MYTFRGGCPRRDLERLPHANDELATARTFLIGPRAGSISADASVYAFGASPPLDQWELALGDLSDAYRPITERQPKACFRGVPNQRPARTTLLTRRWCRPRSGEGEGLHCVFVAPVVQLTPLSHLHY